jgi:hypothetical protein
MRADELAAKLKAHPFEDVREELLDTVLTEVVLPIAIGHTHVRTGRLRTSQTHRVEPGGRRGSVSSDVEYAAMEDARHPIYAPTVTDSKAPAERLLQKIGQGYFDAVVK